MVGGTTSVDEDGVVVGDTPYDQAREILGKIEHELGRFGILDPRSSPDDAIDVYATERKYWESLWYAKPDTGQPQARR